MRLHCVAQRIALVDRDRDAAGGHMIDQAWQPRLAEGMVRAYLVEGRVAGFGAGGAVTADGFAGATALGAVMLFVKEAFSLVFWVILILLFLRRIKMQNT